MSKFNTTNVRAKNGNGFIESSGPVTSNYKGGESYAHTEKSELFLAAVSDFGGESSFYESAENRSDRIVNLAKSVAVTDPQWFSSFVKWLRTEANLRSVSLTLALEGAKALVEAKIPGGRAIVASVLIRADEPGEALGYWISKHGRNIPSAVKRGIADAVANTYNEYSLGKYDTASKGFRFGDVIRLVHPTPKTPMQSDLFKFAIERAMDSAATAPTSLVMADKRKALLAMSKDKLRALITSAEGSDALKEAGLTWENIGGQIGLDAKTWEALIPSMGYMALLRNLRNFEEAGVSDKVLDVVATRLADPNQVAKSRQLPFRFLSAFLATSGQASASYDYWGNSSASRFKASESLRFAYPLERALNASLDNVPYLKGKTLILVDRSGSMFGSPSKNTQLNFADSAAIFGTTLAVRAEDATLVQFGSNSEVVPFKAGGSVLTTLQRFKGMGGTSTAQALRQHFNGSYDRVIIVTDEQSNGGDPASVIPSSVPVYTWNLVGYRTGSKATTNRYTFGGLSDQSFKMIAFVEAGRNATWPWEEV